MWEVYEYNCFVQSSAIVLKIFTVSLYFLCTGRALAAMRRQTGTCITFQALRQGMGTGACGPAIAKEHRFPA